MGRQFEYQDDDIVVPATVVEDVFHYAVHEGLGFTVADYSGGGDALICFKTPNTDNYLHILWKFGTQDNAVFNIHEGVTAANGASDVVVYNKNRAAGMNGGGASAVIAGVSETAGSVQTTKAWTGGTIVYSEFAAKGGGSDNDVSELVLEKNTWYGFELDTANKECGLTLTWFEVPIAT